MRTGKILLAILLGTVMAAAATKPPAKPAPAKTTAVVASKTHPKSPAKAVAKGAVPAKTAAKTVVPARTAGKKGVPAKPAVKTPTTAKTGSAIKVSSGKKTGKTIAKKKRKAGRRRVHYLLPMMDPITEETFKYKQLLNIRLETAFKRIARVRPVGACVSPGPASIQAMEQTLAQLRPTMVSGLIRLTCRAELEPENVATYAAVRDCVLNASPNCVFDAALDAREYTAPREIVAQMQAVNGRVKVDMWRFEGLDEAYRDYRATVVAAIAYAHSQGQAVGGSVAEAGIPPYADYVIVDGSPGPEWVAESIAGLKGPSFIQVVVAPYGFLDPEAVPLSPERERSLKALAEGQKAGGYRVIYPCVTADPAVARLMSDYN